MSEDEQTDRRSGESDGERPIESQEADHVEDVPDGAGCVEIWERLSEDRTGDGE